jgi:hypothetical protein
VSHEPLADFAGLFLGFVHAAPLMG